MAKRNSLKQINKRYHADMRKIIKGDRESEIFVSLAHGKNSYLRLDRIESSSFDRRWIDMIEDVIFDLGDIIANPRLNTKVEGNLVPVELARKTNAESVQHLASHTQYIKEVDEYGNVIPSKLLTTVADDDIKTYENRFIATFVRRLVLFIEKRYEFVSKFAELHNEEILYFKNKSVVDGATVEIETKIKVSHKSDDKLSLESNAYVAKIKELRDYILYFYSSPFMKALKTEKDVRNPIIQTNIIRKNPKYHHCYEVYRFIETYEHLGVSYQMDENYSLFTNEEMNELNQTLFANYITLKGKDRSKEAKVDSKIYKPKVLTSMDDESFVYGPLLTGPISFVRTDEQYQEYLNSKLSKELPENPTKQEKEYYQDEYDAIEENKQDQRQKELLLRRKEKELQQFEKEAERIQKEREKARLALLKKEKDLIKKEENAMLEEARRAIIEESLLDKKQTPEEIEAEEKAYLASIKPAVLPKEMSHPYQDPLTYDEAVLEVWPQLQEKPQQQVVEEKSQEQPVKQAEKSKVKPVSTQEEEEEEIGLEMDAGPDSEENMPVPATVTPMSHPESKPVTYDEAVEEIWPQIKEQPAPRPVEQPQQAQPAQQEQPAPVAENKPAPVVVPMSHPEQKPVTYDEAVEEIWPQIKNAPTSAPKREEPVKEQPKEKEIVPVIVEVPVPMSHPEQEPVTYDEATLEIWPQLANAPTFAPKREYAEPVSISVEAKQPQEENKEVEPVPAQDVTPMSHPESKPVTYDEAVEEIWPQIKNAPTEAPKREPVKPVVIPVNNEPKKPVHTKIYGKFVIKAAKGYYVRDGSFSPNTKDAYIFSDYDAAKKVKKLIGGVIIKIL